MNCRAMILLVGVWLVTCGSVTNAFSVVVYGGKSLELPLLTAKIAAKRGLEASYICAAGNEEGCRRLMYGNEYAGGDVNEDWMAKLISSGDQIGQSLESADAIVLVCYDEPIDEKTLETILSNTGDNLSKLVILSKMGITQNTGSFFGTNNKLLDGENLIRSKAEKRNLQFSIVRAGTLKGGGPGKDGNDFGLNKSYYNTLFDIVEAQVTMGHDKFTLGADCSSGDCVKLPNMFEIIGTKSSFAPRQCDTSRTVAAGAVVATLFHDEAVEVSVGAAKGEYPPSADQWESILSKL